jgi:2-C-methyl-D-erythritol 2,4-cyclodiphosphate synthase
VRIGHGFDVHKLVKGRKLILGGVEIPFDKGLEGHSDADVLIHAIIDAILGAIGAEDIGTHFPDTDPAYKDISSMILLGKTAEILGESKYHLGNIDALLHADKPKVKDFIPRMRKNIASVLECREERVNIKATTWEGLGFVGRMEGMAASAVCLVYPDVWDEESDDAPFGTGHLFTEDDPPMGVQSTLELEIPLKPGKINKGNAFLVNIDGASRGNPGPAGVGIVIRDPDGLVLAEVSEAIGEATNNVAEYMALLRALDECKLLKAQEIILRTDSQLLARQLNGRYKVRNEGLRPIFNKAIKLLRGFKAFTVVEIPRKDNAEADALAKAATKKGK